MLQPDWIENLLLWHLKKHNLLSDVENQPWTVQYSKLGGRGIFAKRDIKRGEVIFIDKPLLRGPRCYNKYLPMCVNCYKSECPLFPCDKGCGLPICSDECENGVTHANRECKYLQNLEPTCGTMWSIDLLKAVVPIRALTLSQYEKDLIGSLQCHNGIRNGCNEIDLLEKNVAKEIESSDREFMMQLCRVLETNAFETVGFVDNSTSISLRGLYPLGAFLNHCCTPNVRLYFTKTGLMVARAAVSVSEGEEITISYTDFFWDTSQRWEYLVMSKNFVCSCNRCSDPMELGSNMGALKCKNIMCCGNIFPHNPLDSETSWTCSECMDKTSQHQVNEIRSDIKEIVNNVLGHSPREILHFIENELKSFVPTSNAITLDLKFRVVSYFGRVEGLQWKDLTDEELEFKAKYCNDLVAVLEHVNRGDSQKKGLILLEMYCTKREQLQRKLSGKQEHCNANLLAKDQSRLNCMRIDHIHHQEANDDLSKIVVEVINILRDDVAAPDDIGTLAENISNSLELKYSFF